MTRAVVLLSAAAILIAAFFVGKGVWFAPPAEPVRAALTGNRLEVFGEDEQLLWTQRFPDATADQTPLPSGRHRAMIADVDGDGRSEVLFVHQPIDSRSPNTRILCSDGQTGWSERWAVGLGTSMSFGDRTFKMTRGEILGVTNAGGHPIVVAYVQDFRWYPSQVVFVDGRDGSLIGEYWHPGFILAHEFIDIDGDGDDELLLGGINNPDSGIGHAALIVLEVPANEDSPRTRAFFGKTSIQETAYLLFPRIDVLAIDESHVFVRVIDVIENDKRILVKLYDEGDNAGSVWYTFDYDLQLLTVRESNQTRTLHSRLHSAGLLDHELTDEEVESWGVVARFPTAPHGNSEEVAREFQRLQPTRP